MPKCNGVILSVIDTEPHLSCASGCCYDVKAVQACALACEELPSSLAPPSAYKVCLIEGALIYVDDPLTICNALVKQIGGVLSLLLGLNGVG